MECLTKYRYVGEGVQTLRCGWEGREDFFGNRTKWPWRTREKININNVIIHLRNENLSHRNGLARCFEKSSRGGPSLTPFFRPHCRYHNNIVMIIKL